MCILTVYVWTYLSHLDDMQLGQQVAICQGEMVAIQELSLGEGDAFSGVVVNLFGDGGVQVEIQPLELPEQRLLLDYGLRETQVCISEIYYVSIALDVFLMGTFPRPRLSLYIGLKKCFQLRFSIEPAFHGQD